MAETEWYSDGLRFSCTQCGNCCSGPSGYVWFDPDEAFAMADFLKVDLETFLRQYARLEYERWTIDERWNPEVQGYDCIFLRRDTAGKASCSIYPVRPLQCRTWPFWRENLSSPRAWQQASRRCPGMSNGKGKLVPVEQIRIIRDSNP